MEIYSKKLEVHNIINERLKLDNKKYELIDKNEDQCKFFKELNMYIPSLLFFLWNKPKIVSEILYNSEITQVREHLAPLIANNFYENIISSNYIEDNLMYVIALLLKKEIDGLQSIEDCQIFLDNSSCGCILEQLRTKNDIKYFFKNIITNVFEKMEVEYSGKNINLNVRHLQDNYQKMKEELDNFIKKKLKKKNKMDDDYYRKIIISNIFSLNEEEEGGDNPSYCIPKDSINSNDFNTKYFPELTKKELENRKNLFEKNNPKMADYCDSIIQKCQNENEYSNQKLLSYINDSPVSKELLTSYQIDFSIIVNIINKILSNLLNDLYLLPYSVKSICKIILLLIKKKFKDIKETELNLFMSKFFFDKLFIPIFENPGLGASIDNIIFSGTTQYNASIINFVFKKLVSGRFFTNDNEQESDYTPFNWYFLEKMPELQKFFEDITKVNLPFFIEKLIADELPEDFELDYFAENPGESICHRSICYTLDDLMAILEGMNKCKDKIFPENNNDDKIMIGLQKTFEKLMNESCMKSLEKLKSVKEHEIVKIQKNKKKEKEVEGREIRKYFLITDLMMNNEFTKLFKIKQEKANFCIEELKKTQTDEEIIQNNIIKVKNFFSTLLYNYRTLIKTDFNDGTTTNTIAILTELKKFLKSSDFVIDGSIPSEWYISSLLEYLKKIPKELIEKDCKELYNQIESDINNSIKELDFEALSVCLGKVKFAKRTKNNYEITLKNLLNIDLNEKTQTVIEKFLIPVKIKYNFSKKEKFFSITEKPITKEMIQPNQSLLSGINILDLEENDKKQRIKIKCKSIKSFTKKFPDLVKRLQMFDRGVIEMEKEMKITEQLNTYFEIIKKIIMNKVSDEKEMAEISNRIYDYVMEKIYEKIYPVEPDPKDMQFFTKCVLLSWVEPKHLISKKTNYIFDSFLPDVIEFFRKMDKEKSPRIKFFYMKKIFGSISDVLRFNGGDGSDGLDDQIPILNYAFIKAKPQHIFSNCKYMDLFLGENKNKLEENQWTQLEGTCEHILNLNYNELNEVTEEEYKEKCKLALYE